MGGSWADGSQAVPCRTLRRFRTHVQHPEQRLRSPPATAGQRVGCLRPGALVLSVQHLLRKAARAAHPTLLWRQAQHEPPHGAPEVGVDGRAVIVGGAGVRPAR